VLPKVAPFIFVMNISKLEKIEELFKSADPLGMIKKSYDKNYYNPLALKLAINLNFSDSDYSITYKLWKLFCNHYKNHIRNNLWGSELLKIEDPDPKEYDDKVGPRESFLNLAKQIKAVLRE
jgi:hypothetical protein